MVGLLQVHGHRGVHVVLGLAALARTTNTRFDIALLDLDPRGLDGFTLARQLCAQGFDAPLLAATARADTKAEGLAYAVGYHGFLRKPWMGKCWWMRWMLCCRGWWASDDPIVLRVH
jgi:CheY-like chemotaxis protein